MSTNQRTLRPTRTIRVSNQLWAASKAKAAERGETVGGVIVKFLEHYAGVPEAGSKADRGRRRQENERYEADAL